MLTSLEQVIHRIVTGYDPDRIILFGSHAAGGAHEDSDIDLLIVKDARSALRTAEVAMAQVQAALIPHTKQ
jgi:uncharacterized protein